MDRQYSLETIGVLRPWDNVDGLFVEYLREAYKEYFSHQNRFHYQDIAQADPVLLKSKIPYPKLIEDPDVLHQLARSLRAESLIRTKVFKEGRKYRFTLDWLHSGRLDVLSTESFTISDPEPGKPMQGEDLSVPLFKAVDSLLSALPFSGQVTGRDHDWVPLVTGRNVRLAKGDQVVLSTIDEVKRHPLLKTIVDWRMSETGRVEVDEVDGGTAFAKVIEEVPGKLINRYQKVVKVIPAPAQQVVQTKDAALIDEIERKRYEPPKTGWISGGLWLGPYSRENSSLNNTAGKSGGGFLYGAKADLEIWMNRNVFADLGFGYGLLSFSQNDIVTGQGTAAGSVSANASRFLIDVGYSYLVTGQFWGPKFWGKLGYHHTSYNLPSSSTEQTGSSSFGALFIGIGGDLPIRDEYGGLLELNLGLIRGYSESGFSVGNQTGISDVTFFIGGYYRYAPRINFRLGIDVLANGTDYDTGASVSHRVISFGPSVQYFF